MPNRLAHETSRYCWVRAAWADRRAEVGEVAARIVRNLSARSLAPGGCATTPVRAPSADAIWMVPHFRKAVFQGP
ncbi:hypothetical protein ACFP1Z_02090 [Streptomyces gamaensis]|uniref:Uncharacterized protein n=1 Tax=Streptomyces gamaensis TaxID=1763542 RepID=A0ABW0YR05_9ACTN